MLQLYAIILKIIKSYNINPLKSNKSYQFIPRDNILNNICMRGSKRRVDVKYTNGVWSKEGVL
jgi:hypothetical protein